MMGTLRLCLRKYSLYRIGQYTSVIVVDSFVAPVLPFLSYVLLSQHVVTSFQQPRRQPVCQKITIWAADSLFCGAPRHPKLFHSHVYACCYFDKIAAFSSLRSGHSRAPYLQIWRGSLTCHGLLQGGDG